jgi:hypothetical protein
VLEDGTYDVFVVDATPVEGRDDAFALDLTVVAGDHKGEVVTITAEGLGLDELDLLGIPGSLTVSGGEPSFTPEP